MRFFLISCAGLLSLLAACSSPTAKSGDGDVATKGYAGDSATAAPTDSRLTDVFTIREPQLVAATLVGERLFTTSPRWSHNPTFPVAEVGADRKTLKPYPDGGWCTWNDSVKNEPQKHWICPQGLITDDQGFIWVLDPAAPGMKYNVAGGAKLVKIDPNTNSVVQTITFGRDVLPHRAYLNDVRVDTKLGVAYLTESNIGGLYVVDLKTRKIRRLLTQHPSVHAEPKVRVQAEGHPMIDEMGRPMVTHSDGIALTRDGQYLYYHALTGYTLYRVATAALRDASLSEAALGAKVEKIATTPATDGMECDAKGNVYLTAFEKNALVRVTPAGKVETIVTDARLQWPDSYHFTPDGQLYVSASLIHKMPQWNQGVSQQTTPFRVLRMKLPE